MKSLLKTLPSAQTVELWGALVRTNLKTVVDLSEETHTDEERLLVPLVMDVFTDVEKFDLKVKKGSVTLRGRKISIWMAPERKFRESLKAVTGSPRAEGTCRLSRCYLCGQVVTEKVEQVDLHRPDCPMVAMVEVMET